MSARRTVIVGTLLLLAAGALAEEPGSVTVGGFVNVKYVYGGYLLAYRTRSLGTKERMRVAIDLKGYRFTSAVIGEYNRLTSLAELRIGHTAGERWEHSLFARGGLSVILDFTDRHEPSMGFGVVSP